MTIIESNYYQCAICGTVSEDDELISTYYDEDDLDEWVELDLRPAFDNSFKYRSGFQRCPKCHYIAEEIEEDVSDEIKSFVLSNEYKKLEPTTNIGQYTALLALSQMKGDYESALTATRRLSWIYDDSIECLESEIAESIKKGVPAETIESLREELKQDREKTQLYRRKALEILETHEDALTLDFDVITGLIADLHRRCGDFEKVIQFCSENGSVNKYMRDNLRFEVYLSSQNDSARHDIREAMKYGEKHPDDVISLQNGISVTIPKTGRSWVCPSCGTKGITTHYCPKCGRYGWMCPTCHHKWNAGDVCDNCKTPKPVENYKMWWICPKCHNKLNYGKVCRNCGEPKPEVKTWECPVCHQKENTDEICSKCEFPYWYMDNPLKIRYYEYLLEKRESVKRGECGDSSDHIHI